MSNIFRGGDTYIISWKYSLDLSSCDFYLLGQLTRIDGLWEDINPSRTVSPVVLAILP